MKKTKYKNVPSHNTTLIKNKEGYLPNSKGGKVLKRCRGSLTVEAALVLPIFLFLSISLISVIEIMNCYIEMEYAVHETAREIAIAYYPFRESEEVNETVVELMAEGILIDKLGIKGINNMPIKNGLAGINVFRSEVTNSDLDLIVTYRVTPLLNIFGVGEMTLISRAKIHLWTGYELPKDKSVETEYVYVTDYRSVYHTRSDCSHLYLEVKNVSLGDIDKLRNDEGKKYTPCKICVGETSGLNGDVIYVTSHGSSYHNTDSCSGLKRTVHKVKLEEVAGLPMCQRCQAYMVSH